ncbi:TPR-like protein [Auriculariales sp. MPI-PUGE-AT-0066]|nr:TPR-like protein [Auriculariales sp. MPI-PUGE-AT-0066]
MGRLKGGKQLRGVPHQVKAPPTTDKLLAKAQQLVAQCDFDLSRKFIDRILQSDPNNLEARELLGVVLLEIGDVETARQNFRGMLDFAVVPPSAHLYLAQLDENPHSALVHYEAAIGLFSTQLKGKGSGLASHESDEELKSSIIQALCAMVEIWMSDLCMEESAEANCDALLARATSIDQNNAATLQSLASCRLSQSRPDDARVAVERSWAAWRDLDPDDLRRPDIPQRIALAKLFLELAQHYTELALFENALAILQDVLASDDQEVMGWYLEGWCYLLMAEHGRTAGVAITSEDGDGVPWTEIAHDAKECLESCKSLHIAQEHPDDQVLQHVQELLTEIDLLNLPPRAEDGAEGEWVDDDDDDVEMS